MFSVSFFFHARVHDNGNPLMAPTRSRQQLMVAPFISTSSSTNRRFVSVTISSKWDSVVALGNASRSFPFFSFTRQRHKPARCCCCCCRTALGGHTRARNQRTRTHTHRKKRKEKNKTTKRMWILGPNRHGATLHRATSRKRRAHWLHSSESIYNSNGGRSAPHARIGRRRRKLAKRRATREDEEWPSTPMFLICFVFAGPQVKSNGRKHLALNESDHRQSGHYWSG